MSLILNGTTGISDVDGTAAAPALTGTDTNTGIFFPAADTIAFAEGGVESVRIDASGNVGIGSVPVNSRRLTLNTSGQTDLSIVAGSTNYAQLLFGYTGADNKGNISYYNGDNSMQFYTNATERARIDSSGNLLVGKTATTFSTAGSVCFNTGQIQATVSGDDVIAVNRLTNDGDLVRFFQATTQEGSISVSGSTVSYNGGHLSRWAQTAAPKDNTLVKGTVLSNLDEMNVYTKDGQPVDNEQLNKVKVSDIEGDANVAGVFVNWSHDDAHDVDEINMAMTGDMIIRIAQGTTVARGDLLMSAGDGTAKPQGDDIVRSKTVAKVTSTHVTCTYADGSYCVPCVLMAC